MNEAIDLLEQALRSDTEELPDGAILSLLGRAYLESGRTEEAISLQQQALDLLEEEGDLPRQVRARMRLGLACHKAGRLDEAQHHLEAARPLMHALGDVIGEGRLLTNLGTVYVQQGQWHQALESWESARRLQARLKDHLGLGHTIYNLADAYWEQGNHVIAHAFFRKVRALAERYGLNSLLDKIAAHPANQGE